MFIDACPGFFTIEHFCEIFDNSFIGCLIIDADTLKPLSANQIMSSVTGLSLADFQEAKVCEENPELKAICNNFRDVVIPNTKKYGHSKTFVIHLTNPNTDETVYLKVQCFMLNNEVFDKNFLFIIAVDISEQKIALQKYNYKNLRTLSSSAALMEERRFEKKLVELKLTLTEINICLRLRKSMSSKEIAADLGISKATVNTHRRNLRSKLGLKGSRDSLFGFLIKI